MDAEKEGGPALKEKYRIPGYPTMVFLNGNEEEIDRIVGYRPPDQFLVELQRIQSGRNTFLSLRDSVEKKPDHAGAIVLLAEKYSDRNEPDRALELWYQLKALNMDDYNHMAEFNIISMEAFKTMNADGILEFIDGNQSSPYYLNSLVTGMRILGKTGNKNEEARLYREYIHVLETSGDLKYSHLNGFAWRMTELELHLEEALERARMAVDMSESEDETTQAQVLDTLAEVYWKLGDRDRAIEIIDMAITLQPDDPYYREQKEKFSG